MPASKAQQKAVTKYVKAKYDRFGLTMPKGNLNTIKAHAEVRGESTNAFIGRAIQETMERDDRSQKPAEGGRYAIPVTTLEAAQEAAEAAGETMPVFVARAVETQAERDALARKIGGGENQ